MAPAAAAAAGQARAAECDFRPRADYSAADISAAVYHAVLFPAPESAPGLFLCQPGLGGGGGAYLWVDDAQTNYKVNASSKGGDGLVAIRVHLK